MQRTRGKHAAMFLSACVGLHVCNTIVSLHMKIWERFCLKLESRHFKRISSVYASCPWMPEVLHHGNMKYDFHIHSLYFFGIQRKTCEWSWISFINSILRDFFCGCLGFKIPLNFYSNEGILSNDFYIHETPTFGVKVVFQIVAVCFFICTLEFQIHVLPFLSSRLPSCRIPSCWMDGIHAICLSTTEKVVTESLKRGHRMPHRSSSPFLIGQFFIIYVTMWSGHTPTLSAGPFPTQGDGVNGMACRECALAFVCNQSHSYYPSIFVFSLYMGHLTFRDRVHGAGLRLLAFWEMSSLLVIASR